MGSAVANQHENSKDKIIAIARSDSCHSDGC